MRLPVRQLICALHPLKLFLVSVNGLLGKANFCIFLSSLGSGFALSGKEYVASSEKDGQHPYGSFG